MENSFDVVVIGGGGSGLAAAVSSAERGLRVLVLEKCSECGGTTGIAVGSFTACDTRMQQSQGIKDNLQWHVEDAARFAPPEIEQRNNHALRSMLLSESAATLEWLIEMGIQFQGPNPEPPNRVARMHNVVPRAQVTIVTLKSRLLKLGGQIICNANVTALVKEGTRVTGVSVALPDGDCEFQAKRGVILAAGDYSNSSSLISDHKGAGFATIEGINRHARGDGHRLAQAAGAALKNMDICYGPELRFIPPVKASWIERLPTQGWLARAIGKLAQFVPKPIERRIALRLLVTWQHPEDTLFNDGAILLNKEGQRFCDELVSPDREIAVSCQTDKQCYILLDGSLVKKYSEWPNFVSTAPQIAYAYVSDYERLRPDMTHRGETLPQAATQSGLPASAVENSVRKLRDQGKRPLREGPWVVLGPAKAYFTTTEGGAAIDQDMRVLDESGNPIAGLYAVGQNGLGGQILWGHGLHIAWAMTSGRLVGRSLATPAENLRS